MTRSKCYSGASSVLLLPRYMHALIFWLYVFLFGFNHRASLDRGELQSLNYGGSQHDTQQQITHSRLSVKTYPVGSVPLSFRESFPLLPC